MIDITKKYRTRDGREVTGLHMRDSEDWPIGGLIDDEAETWTATGAQWEGSESPVDLIEVVDEQSDTELTELRAFRDAAIAKYPDLAPDDPVDAEVQRIYYEWLPQTHTDTSDLIRVALLRGIEMGKGGGA